MDTKSKSSKKFSFLAAAIWVLLAAAAFLALYPVFDQDVSVYYTDELKSRQLLQEMYRGNFVLYKNMLERTQKEEISWADLYLEMEQEEISLGEMERDGLYFEEEWTSGAMKNYLSANMNLMLSNWKDQMADRLAICMDYCVIDHKSGEILKNTTREIESLRTDDAGGDYAWYVRMTYDDDGNLAGLSVKDEGNRDTLFKNVQMILETDLLGYSLGDYTGRDIASYNDFSLGSEHCFDDSMDGETLRPVKLTWRVNDTLKGMTFIYALTEEQKQNMFNMWKNGDTMGNYHWEIRNAYYEAGTGNIYALILFVLAVGALLMTRNRRYCLHRLPGFRLRLEISLACIFCAVAFFGPWAVSMVYCTNDGFFEEFYRGYLEKLPADFYPVITVTVNILALTVQFGFWYYLFTTLGEVFDLGIMEFLRERSILVRFCVRVAGWFKRKKERIEEEILHTDLGGKTESVIRRLLLINFVILGIACTMWMFGWVSLILYTIALYFLLKKYMGRIQQQYHQLFVATRSIADGNLQTQFSSDWGVFESYKQELSRIQNGFKAAVDKEVKSQKMKTELITNVSHDLKTPLTAITTYTELLEQEGISPEQRAEYLQVLKRKSERLKYLIEDLFEVSKANSGNISLTPVDVDICNLMRQVYLEYEDQVQEAGLIFRFHLPQEKVILKLDSQKTCRVFENLYINIIKYAMPNTRVYVSGERTEKGIFIELKNMSATELNIAPQELTERFVRGDSARNTEGSGLGLAIARSFVELQGGQLAVEIDGDLFKVKIEWQNAVAFCGG